MDMCYYRFCCWSDVLPLICNQQVGGSNPSTSSKSNMEEFQSGQMGQTVNLLSLTSVVRIHPPPPGNTIERSCFFFASGHSFCLRVW